MGYTVNQYRKYMNFMRGDKVEIKAGTFYDTGTISSIYQVIQNDELSLRFAVTIQSTGSPDVTVNDLKVEHLRKLNALDNTK